MNHLAHFHLAGENQGYTIGNYIADHVKGKQKDNYPDEIRKGIEMHRAIDYYTDNHPIVKKAVSILKPTLGRYGSIAIDVIYDHFLAKNWEQFHHQDLQEFVDFRYSLLEEHIESIPTPSQRFYHYMIRNNILQLSIP